MKNKLKLLLLPLMILSSKSFATELSSSYNPETSVLITVSPHHPGPPACGCMQKKPVCSIRTRTEGLFPVFTVVIGQNLFGEYETYPTAISTIRQLRTDQLCL